MTLPCQKATIIPPCTPSCTRWTSINEGQPVVYFHDTTNWNPGCYTAFLPGLVDLDEPDPQAYLDPAIALWQSGYPCGTLFQRTMDRAQANLIIQYGGDNGTVVGNATCYCDADDDVCIRQVDHNQFFNTSNPAIFLTSFRISPAIECCPISNPCSKSLPRGVCLMPSWASSR